jgi:hypothetical protein
MHYNTGHTQKNGAVSTVNSFETAPFFCVCSVFIVFYTLTDRQPVRHGEAELSGAFAKLRKAAFGFVMPVCLSVYTKQFGSHWKDFHKI